MEVLQCVRNPGASLSLCGIAGGGLCRDLCSVQCENGALGYVGRI